MHKSPDNPALLLNLGLAYYKTGRLAEAAARFERAVSLAPQFKEQVTLLLASCYNNLGRYKEAMALLAPLEKDKSGDSGVRLSLWNGSYRRWTERRRSRGHRPHPQPRAILPKPACCAAPWKLSAHDRDGALADLEKAIALNPKLPGAHARLGELLLSKGDDRTRPRRLHRRTGPRSR